MKKSLMENLIFYAVKEFPIYRLFLYSGIYSKYKKVIES